MRNITHTASRALFSNGLSFGRDNTHVIRMKDPIGNHTSMQLHGHTIAILYDHNILRISTCNHETATTKERLNGVLLHAYLNGLIPQLYLYQSNWLWYISDHKKSFLWDYFRQYSDLHGDFGAYYIDARDLLRAFN